MTPAAVIFDMDGLLLDTERIAYDAFQKACAELGTRVDKALYLSCIGTNMEETNRILRAGMGEEFPLDRLLEVWEGLYSDAALKQPVPLKQGAENLLRRLSDDGWEMAVATSTEHAWASVKLRNAGILDRFRFVVAGDQVSNGKPDPEIYTTAAERLGFSPGSCLALEDSDNGVRAAHAAGLRVIQVPDMVPPSPDVLALGHAVMASLHEVADHLLGA